MRYAALACLIALGCAAPQGEAVDSNSDSSELHNPRKTIQRFRTDFAFEADPFAFAEPEQRERPFFEERRGLEPPSDQAEPIPAGDRFAGAPSGACQARCGDDRYCIALCSFTDDMGGAEASPIDCLNCSRETGFLPRPVLHADLEPGGVHLYWGAVPGAERYSMHAMRWGRGGPAIGPDASYVWAVDGTELHVQLDEGYTYSFYVVAVGDDGKTRSHPSAPVSVDL